jgi:hypothetical protein
VSTFSDSGVEYQRELGQLCELLRHPEGAKLMNDFAGGNRLSVSPSVLDALAADLLLLSHYCAVMPTNEQHTALQFLENALLRLSNRADEAATIADAELEVARERPTEDCEPARHTVHAESRKQAKTTHVRRSP